MINYLGLITSIVMKLFFIVAFNVWTKNYHPTLTWKTNDSYCNLVYISPLNQFNIISKY